MNNDTKRLIFVCTSVIILAISATIVLWIFTGVYIPLVFLLGLAAFWSLVMGLFWFSGKIWPS